MNTDMTSEEGGGEWGSISPTIHAEESVAMATWN